jgi:hypothetical protein
MIKCLGEQPARPPSKAQTVKKRTKVKIPVLIVTQAPADVSK